MVNFALLNELSLPFKNDINIENHFKDFLELIKILKTKNIKKLRIDKDLKSYKIFEDIYFPQFLGQLRDKELKDKLRAFIANNTIKIGSPLITSDEDEQELLLENEYFYNSLVTTGALACSDIWDTLTISFNSSQVWSTEYIEIEKLNILEDKKTIKIKNASYVSHLDTHQEFFQRLEEYIRLDINISNFWNRKDELFQNKIILCVEVEKQVSKLDSNIFIQTLSILRDIDSGIKNLHDFNASGESKSVEQDLKLKKLREFDIDGKKEYFQNHIKLSGGYRIHYFEKNSNIYIGYIGTHLKTKKFD